MPGESLCVTHTNAHGYRNGNAYCYRGAEAYADAQAASHTAASPVTSRLTRSLFGAREAIRESPFCAMRLQGLRT